MTASLADEIFAEFGRPDLTDEEMDEMTEYYEKEEENGGQERAENNPHRLREMGLPSEA